MMEEIRELKIERILDEIEEQKEKLIKAQKSGKHETIIHFIDGKIAGLQIALKILKGELK